MEIETKKERWELEGDNAILAYYDWLRGILKHPNLECSSASPNLSDEKAFAILYTLQEVLGVISDKFEKCSRCGKIYDTEKEGTHVDDGMIEEHKEFKKWDDGKFYCECCLDRVQYYQDRKKLTKKYRNQSLDSHWMYGLVFRSDNKEDAEHAIGDGGKE